MLTEVSPGVTRVRVRGGEGDRFHGLPLPLTKLVIRLVRFIRSATGASRLRASGGREGMRRIT